MNNCSSALNKMAISNKWKNCDSLCLHVDTDDLQWKSNSTFEVLKTIPHYLKIDEGMIIRSLSSGRKFIIAERVQRKEFRLEGATRKSERKGDWEIFGSRTYTLSKRVQLRGTECGSYCIHLILESLHGKSWH